MRNSLYVCIIYIGVYLSISRYTSHFAGNWTSILKCTLNISFVGAFSPLGAAYDDSRAQKDLLFPQDSILLSNSSQRNAAFFPLFLSCHHSRVEMSPSLCPIGGSGGEGGESQGGGRGCWW